MQKIGEPEAVAKFKMNLAEAIEEFKTSLATGDGDWVVKGFIDIYQNIYTISGDTKVVSKIIELMLFPLISRFAKTHQYAIQLCAHQNHYPDTTFISQDGTKIAVDLKSTYRTNGASVNGLTLGAFTGYFRDRTSTKNTSFPYEQYAAHLVLGVIYSRADHCVDEQRIYSINELQSIVSVARDFEFLLQEKWRIASDRPGSGNTKNIGSVTNISALKNGKGPFEAHGVEVFDEYWMHYLTADMARAIESTVPYHNLKEFLEWRKKLCRLDTEDTSK